MNTNDNYDNHDRHMKAFMEAFQQAHEQMRRHKYKKMDYLGKGWRKEASWRDAEHPLSDKHKEDRARRAEHEARMLDDLHQRHGWGGEKDEYCVL